MERPVHDPDLLARAEEWLATDHRPEVEPRLAATVMLVRDTSSGPEVYVQRRVATMAFAPSRIVFPGGGVDPRDHGFDVETPGLADLATAMGVPARQAAHLAGLVPLRKPQSDALRSGANIRSTSSTRSRRWNGLERILASCGA